jgi:hypothetical protein
MQKQHGNFSTKEEDNSFSAHAGVVCSLLICPCLGHIQGEHITSSLTLSDKLTRARHILDGAFGSWGVESVE